MRARRYVLLAFLSAFIVGANSLTALASTAPGLGTAASFAVLAGTPSITNTGPTVINLSVGIHPAASVIGFPPGIVGPPGTIQAGTAAAGTAKSDLVTAYDNAASSPCNSTSLVPWGGQTLTPGTYCQTTSPTISGILTLSGNGVFIFKTGSTLVTASGARVVLINGAQPCNVFWQVSSSATLGTGTTFVGTIMALTSITVATGTNIAGRALARNGTVTLDTNTITAPTTCAAATVLGPPGTGGGPPQGEGFPWILAMVAGVLASAGAVGLGISVRTRRRRA